MKTWKWIALCMTGGGIVFSLGSCATELGSIAITYLPSLLDAYLETLSTSS